MSSIGSGRRTCLAEALEMGESMEPIEDRAVMPPVQQARSPWLGRLGIVALTLAAAGGGWAIGNSGAAAAESRADDAAAEAVAARAEADDAAAELEAAASTIPDEVVECLDSTNSRHYDDLQTLASRLLVRVEGTLTGGDILWGARRSAELSEALVSMQASCMREAGLSVEP